VWDSGLGPPADHRNRPRAHSEGGQEVDALLAAVSAGGQIAVAAGENEWGGYFGHVTDSDGFLRKVASA
jgi:uncharacterized glyoxalase superfamily protein PhnB